VHKGKVDRLVLVERRQHAHLKHMKAHHAHENVAEEMEGKVEIGTIRILMACGVAAHPVEEWSGSRGLASADRRPRSM
jgi:hypothetical protein